MPELFIINSNIPTGGQFSPVFHKMASRKAFLLRINEQLYKELESWAQEDFRSVNGQIEFLLRQMVRRRRGEVSGESSSQELDSGK
jgi:hypothetical protein